MTGVEQPWPCYRLSMISLLETKPRSPRCRTELAGRGSASPPCHIDVVTLFARQSTAFSGRGHGCEPRFLSRQLPPGGDTAGLPKTAGGKLGLFSHSHDCMRECALPSCSGEPHPCSPGKGEQLCLPVKHHLLAEASEELRALPITGGAMGGVCFPQPEITHRHWQHPTGTLLRSPMGARRVFFNHSVPPATLFGFVLQRGWSAWTAAIFKIPVSRRQTYFLSHPTTTPKKKKTVHKSLVRNIYSSFLSLGTKKSEACSL